MAGIIDDADRLRIGMIAGANLLNVVPKFVMVPDIGVEELLERAWSQVV